MKQLLIEEKAKAYDKALERARTWKEKSGMPKDKQGILDDIFPELAESEEEKIRKWLIAQLELKSDVHNPHDLELMILKSIDWLEKQGEKPQGKTYIFEGKSVLEAIKEEKQDMQKEINLIEILKHYPKETELYSPLYGKLWLAKVDEKNEIVTCYKHPLNKGCTRAILEQEDTISFFSNGTTGLPDFDVSKDCMLFLHDIEK